MDTLLSDLYWWLYGVLSNPAWRLGVNKNISDDPRAWWEQKTTGANIWLCMLRVKVVVFIDVYEPTQTLLDNNEYTNRKCSLKTGVI